MNSAEKNKLRHDFFNAIAILNSMTNSASGFFITITKNIDETEYNQQLINKFTYAIQVALEQSKKIENYFIKILDNENKSY